MNTRRRIGDIYVVSKDGAELGLLHYVGNDSSLPGSNVVEIIAPIPEGWTQLDDKEFAKIPRNFAAHAFVRAGETLDMWSRVSNRKVLKQNTTRWCTVPPEELGKDSSKLWRVWTTDSPMTAAKNTKDIEGAEPGYVFSPINIVHRILEGKYTLHFPSSVG